MAVQCSEESVPFLTTIALSSATPEELKIKLIVLLMKIDKIAAEVSAAIIVDSLNQRNKIVLQKYLREPNGIEPWNVMGIYSERINRLLESKQKPIDQRRKK